MVENWKKYKKNQTPFRPSSHFLRTFFLTYCGLKSLLQFCYMERYQGEILLVQLCTGETLRSLVGFRPNFNCETVKRWKKVLADDIHSPETWATVGVRVEATDLHSLPGEVMNSAPACLKRESAFVVHCVSRMPIHSQNAIHI